MVPFVRFLRTIKHQLGHGAVGNVQILSFECVKVTWKLQVRQLLSSSVKIPQTVDGPLGIPLFQSCTQQVFVEWLPCARRYCRSGEHRSEGLVYNPEV